MFTVVIFSPLEQFEITNLVNFGWGYICPSWDIGFTNNSITSLLIFSVFIWFNIYLLYGIYLVPSTWQFFFEGLVNFVRTMVHQQTSTLHALRFFPLMYSLFSLILISNLVGLLPFAFTITSHLCVTFTLSFVLFLGITTFGLISNKLNFFKFFIPSGVPNFLLPFLIIIEVVSYLIRPFSLSIRLFANMLAGHTLLYILATFVVPVLFSNNTPLLIAVLMPLVLVFLLELAIAFIQTYVFVILTCIYINDMYNVAAH